MTDTGSVVQQQVVRGYPSLTSVSVPALAACHKAQTAQAVAQPTFTDDGAAPTKTQAQHGREQFS